LGQVSALAMFADGLAQCAAVCWYRRHALYKHLRREKDIYYSLILFLLDFVGRRKKARSFELMLGF
jgi:hypothetical protein